jgi:hypothetical protein
MGQVQGFNQITKRMMTDAERQLPVGVYRGVQRAARGISVVCLVLFIMNAYVLSAIITDQITLDTLSIMMSVFMGVFGLVGIGMAVNTLAVRKRVSDAMMEGTAVEVIGPAYKTSAARNVQAWTIGPISMMATREALGLLREGSSTSVLCVPKLKAAVAINNYALRQGARIMFPPNLEAMAIPAGMGPMAPSGQTPVPASSSREDPEPQALVPQAQVSQTSPSEEPPPPPPDEKPSTRGRRKKSSARSK